MIQGIDWDRIQLNDPRDFLIWRKGMGRTVELFDIQVGSERRKGRGKELIETLLRRLPKNTAHVFAITRLSNATAHQFYESLGWRIVGRLHYFYRDLKDVKGERVWDLEHALVYGVDL